jgi:hypothetical protein
MSEYLQKVLQASGGHAAPVENLKDEDIRESLKAAGMLVPEEKDLADALLEIVEKHGKFNDDNTGVWAGYTSAKDNAENAAIGVKCGNCVFWEAPNGCKLIVAETEEGGLCRFAVLPDGAVTAGAEAAQLEKDEDDPCWSGYVQVGMKDKNGKRVPNCVPSSAAIDFLINEFNSKFGASRHITKESAYAVARKACDKYSYLDDSALYSAVLWELHVFSEYATSGTTDVEQEFSVYAEYLPEGHPTVESSLAASAAWVAGAAELDNSGREALLTAFSEDVDYVKSLHASTRVRAMVSSGSLTNATLQYIKNLSDKHSKVS